MIDALIAGRLHGVPQARTTKTGSQFVTCTVRITAREGGSLFASVIAFSATACRALLALQDGDAVALSGELTPKVYQPKDGGEPRPSVDLVAHQVLTEYHVTRKRAAVAESKPSAPRAAIEPTAAVPAEPDLNDAIPF